VLATSTWIPATHRAQASPHQQATAPLNRRAQLPQTLVIPIGVAVEVLVVDLVGVLAHVLLLSQHTGRL
jgi:hypothetical protein